MISFEVDSKIAFSTYLLFLYREISICDDL